MNAAPSAASAIGAGLAAVVVWASYNIASVVGMTSGFDWATMTLLRFAPAAAIAIAFTGVAAVATLGGIGWVRGLLVGAIGGVAFGYFVYSAFLYAPLAHGIVLAPAAVMLTGMALGRFAAAEDVGAAQVAGGGLLVLGLLLLAYDGLSAGGPNVLLGDAMFVASGACWGVMTYLFKRWKVAPLPGVLAVALPAALLMIPLYLAANGIGLPPAPIASLAVQAFFQGVLGGFIGVYAFVIAVKGLGAARAALFPALTPGVTAALAYPILGDVPTWLQIAGMTVATIGILVAARPARPPTA